MLSRSWNYLTAQDIVDIHGELISRMGGMPGVRDIDALSSCVAQPQTAVFDEERFYTAFEKAAAYCFYVVRLHPFFDGNKRTGLVAAITFLLDQGLTPRFEEDVMYKMVIGCATGVTNVPELARTFKEACD